MRLSRSFQLAIGLAAFAAAVASGIAWGERDGKGDRLDRRVSIPLPGVTVYIGGTVVDLEKVPRGSTSGRRDFVTVWTRGGKDQFEVKDCGQYLNDPIITHDPLTKKVIRVVNCEREFNA